MVSEKKVHTLGSRFSQDVHAIFVTPKAAVRRILDESDFPYSTAVPFLVVIIAAIMSAIGVDLWAQIKFAAQTGSAFLQVINAIGRGVILFFRIVYNSFAFILMWVLWSIIFHFVGSIIASQDITRRGTFEKTLKLTGFTFAPFFLNILPFFSIITGYWAAYIAYLAMKENYKTTKIGALIIILPYLFSVLYGTLIFLLSLF